MQKVENIWASLSEVWLGLVRSGQVANKEGKYQLSDKGLFFKDGNKLCFKAIYI